MKSRIEREHDLQLRELQNAHEKAVAREQTRREVSVARVRFVFGAAIVGIAGFAANYYKGLSTEETLRLKRLEQQQRLANAQMEAVVESGSENGFEKMKRRLRYLANPDASIASWAQDELNTIEAVLSAQQKRKAVERHLEEVESKVQTTQQKLEAKARDATPDRELVDELRAAQAEQARARDELREAKAKANELAAPYLAVESKSSMAEAIRAGKYRGTDLSGVDLSSMNLSGVDLSGTNLRDANLSAADLSRANLKQANLRNANLNFAQLDGASLAKAKLDGASLRYTHANRTIFSGASMVEASLQAADLAGAVHLTQAQLRSACGDGETQVPAGVEIRNCEP